MSTYFWDFIIIGAVVLIFLILARRLPVAAQFQKAEKKAEDEVSPARIVAVGAMAQADDAFDRKDYTAAESLYIKIAAQEPNNFKVYDRLGTIYIVQKNYYDAKDAFLQAIKLESGDLSLFIKLGDAYMGLKDYFKASQSYMQAVEQEPKNKKYRELYEKAQKALDKEKKKKK